ncbi:fimbrillin family protein [Phocaeicola faecicola]|uniref:fimbrillin family protein n=1 Tax=Phocaeicola faecicola TaxID=2739389 RepID=UPI002A7EF97A|nr:fimbrillin family protein [Phocaeicola faecicola]MDY4871083.1 fimbrillin family protein [Phocaeicola faecicola]
MKIQNLIYMGILSTLVLAGCKTNDDNSTWSGSDGIVFNSYIGSHTRASGSSWGNSDEVGIYMTGAGAGIDAATAVNKKYLAQTNGILTPESKTEAIYYPETGNADFVAYYPYSSSVADNIVAVNVSNQSKPEAIDLLYSNNAKNIANGATVSLGFTHQLSLVTIDLKNTDGTIPSLNGTTVSMGGMNTQASFDLDGGVLTVSPQSSEPTLDMYMVAGQDGAMKAQAIVLPTKATGSSQTQMVLTFKLDGMTFEYTVSDISAFEGGKEYLYTADLSINNGKPTVKMGNATITDWVTVPGGDIDVDFDGGSTEPGEEKVLLDESFATGQGQFTIDNKQLPEGSDYVWIHGTYQGTSFMKASAFVGGAKKASESWLVSPELSLADVKSAVLSFEHAHNYAGTASEELTLWITETSAENWKQLTIDKYGEQFKFVAVSVDLASYLGKTVKFAFKYVSTTSAAATWEIKNVKVVANGDGTVDPEPEPEPGVNMLTNPGFEDWTDVLPVAWDNKTYNTGEIVKETSIKHGGNNSLRQTSASGTNKIQQEVAITGGKKYRISYWFLDNDTKASSRYWFALVGADGKTINDLNKQLQQSDYSTDSPEWKNVVIEFTAPENAVKLRYEARTYRNMDSNEAGGYIYYDDMELTEIQ